MLRFEFGTDFFPGVIGRYALAFEREGSRTDFGDQGSVPRLRVNHRRERYGQARHVRR